MQGSARKVVGKVTGISKGLLAVVARLGRIGASEFLSVTAIYAKSISA